MCKKCNALWQLTWPIKDDVNRLEHAEKNNVKWMYFGTYYERYLSKWGSKKLAWEWPSVKKWKEKRNQEIETQRILCHFQRGWAHWNIRDWQSSTYHRLTHKKVDLVYSVGLAWIFGTPNFYAILMKSYFWHIFIVVFSYWVASKADFYAIMFWCDS